MKKIIIIICGILLVTGCGCEKKEENLAKDENITVEGKSEETPILEDSKVSVLKIYDVKKEELKNENGITHFQIFFQNTSDKDIKIGTFKIYFKDKNGNYLLPEPVTTEFNEIIKANEIQSLGVLANTILDDDVIVEYEIVK